MCQIAGYKWFKKDSLLFEHNEEERVNNPVNLTKFEYRHIPPKTPFIQI